MRMITVLAVLFFFTEAGISKTIHVPADYNTIQEAIEAATNGDTVMVHPGIYVENIDFKGKPILVTSDEGPDVTVIDGNKSGSVVIFKSSEGPDSVLDGFTVRNGKTDYGGGIYCLGASPTIRNNIIYGNKVTGTGDGGGIYCRDALPTIRNNNIFRNSAYWGSGGAIGCYLARPKIVDNIIFQNTSRTGGGGGIWLWRSSGEITNNRISKNFAYEGGGIFFWRSHPKVANNMISENKAFDNGGGIYCAVHSKPIITNNEISGNSAKNDYGGGIAVFDHSSPTIANNSIVGNSSINGGGIGIWDFGDASVVNTILWNNDAPNGPEIGLWKSTLTIGSSDVEGGKAKVFVDSTSVLTWGAGMIDADPLFVDSVDGDYHITFPSPCRDAGDDSRVTDSTDFEGDRRITHGSVDMGADEFHTHLYWTGDATPGGHVELKFVGVPGTTPVRLWRGSGVLNPPWPTKFGDWYLKFPVYGGNDLGSIPAPDGVLIVPVTIHGSCSEPVTVPMQALTGMELTNLSVMEVE